MNGKAKPIPTDFDEELLWSRVEITGFCWLWTGCKVAGYGVVGFRREQYRVHRVAYTLLVGEIPGDLELDHLCRNRACVNPDHLEPVTTATNVRRGYGTAARNARKQDCSRGHRLAGENLRIDAAGRRVCVTCSREYHRRYELATYRADPELFAERAREWRATHREEYNRRARERRARAAEAA